MHRGVLNLSFRHPVSSKVKQIEFTVHVAYGHGHMNTTTKLSSRVGSSGGSHLFSIMIHLL